MISVSLRTKAELYQAWMPFLQGGGLFIPTTKGYALGDEEFLLVSFMGEPEKVPLRGKVAWINPEHASGGRPQGIGIRIAPEPVWEEMRKKIEGVLAGVANSPRPTHTI